MGKIMNSHSFYCRIAAFSLFLINVCSALHFFPAHKDKCQVLGLKNLTTEEDGKLEIYFLYQSKKLYTAASMKTYSFRRLKDILPDGTRTF